MKRPAIQFYPGDWRNNANLRRCSWEARGVWIEVIGLLHDSDTYGVLRWPLTEIAQALGAPIKALKELTAKGVLKGSDKGDCEPYIYTARHAGKDGDPVTLIATQPGPIWYSTRMVRDEWVRNARGKGTRFGDDNGPPTRAPNSPPKGGIGGAPKADPSQRIGDGPSSSSSTSLKPKPPESSIEGINTIVAPADADESDPKVDEAEPTPPSTATRQGLVSALLRGLGVQITPGNPHLVGWVQAGVTDEQLREAVARVRLHKPAHEPIPSNYLAKTVLSVLHPPEIPALTAVPSDPNLVPRWWESEAATTEQAKRLGMHARGGEGWAEFRQRIRDRLTAIRTEAAA